MSVENSFWWDSLDILKQITNKWTLLTCVSEKRYTEGDYISPSRSGTFGTNLWEMFYRNLFKMQLYGFVILVNQLLSSELSLNIEDSHLYASDKLALSRLHKSFLSPSCNFWIWSKSARTLFNLLRHIMKDQLIFKSWLYLNFEIIYCFK